MLFFIIICCKKRIPNFIINFLYSEYLYVNFDLNIGIKIILYNIDQKF